MRMRMRRKGQSRQLGSAEERRRFEWQTPLNRIEEEQLRPDLFQQYYLNIIDRNTCDLFKKIVLLFPYIFTILIFLLFDVCIKFNIIIKFLIFRF